MSEMSCYTLVVLSYAYREKDFQLWNVTFSKTGESTFSVHLHLAKILKSKAVRKLHSMEAVKVKEKHWVPWAA